MGAAAILLPLIPGLVKMVLDIVSAARSDAGTSAENKVKLDAISAELQQVAADVAAVELPSGNP